MTFSLLVFFFYCSPKSHKICTTFFLRIIEAFQYSLWGKPFSSQQDKSWSLKRQDLSPWQCRIKTLGQKRQRKRSAFHLFTGSRLKHAYLLLLLFQREMQRPKTGAKEKEKQTLKSKTGCIIAAWNLPAFSSLSEMGSPHLAALPWAAGAAGCSSSAGVSIRTGCVRLCLKVSLGFHVSDFIIILK